MVTYEGFSENNKSIKWTLPISSKSTISSNSKVYLSLTDDGTARLIASDADKQTEIEIWASNVIKCKPTENPLYPALQLNTKTGIPEIKCSSDSASIPLK
jgi:hypothetical protein